MVCWVEKWEFGKRLFTKYLHLVSNLGILDRNCTFCINTYSADGNLGSFPWNFIFFPVLMISFFCSNQIDGSTLRLLCNQHGPLEHFYLNLSQGTALIAYRTPDEAMKAQRTLHSCVLGNTTIIVDFATAADVSRIKDRTVSTSSGGGWSKGGNGGSSNFSSTGGNQWNGGSSLPSLPGGGAMWSTGAPNMWGAADESDSTNSFLPGGLLSGESM